jgi:hypothetical protein
MEHNSVVEHHRKFVRTECLKVGDEVHYCGWCNEGQLGGGDLEHSYYSGCEFCEGKVGWEKD